MLSCAVPLAQTKQAPARAEWGQFETLALQVRGGLSPDGHWLAHGLNRSTGERTADRHIESTAEKAVQFGTGATFSGDSRWIAYAIGYSEAQEERLRTQRRPIHRKVGFLRLDGASEPVVIDGIESFSFDPSGDYMRCAATHRSAAAAALRGDARAGAARRRRWTIRRRPASRSSSVSSRPDATSRSATSPKPPGGASHGPRAHAAPDGGSCWPHDQRRRQDRQRHPPLRPRGGLAPRARFGVGDLQRAGLAPRCRRSRRAARAGRRRP